MPYEAGRTAESIRQQFGLSRVIKLASNENPLGAAPLAIEALRRSLRD
jgi:histidinol-phosphate aminotransferase